MRATIGEFINDALDLHGAAACGLAITSSGETLLQAEGAACIRSVDASGEKVDRMAGEVAVLRGYADRVPVTLSGDSASVPDVSANGRSLPDRVQLIYTRGLWFINIGGVNSSPIGVPTPPPTTTVTPTGPPTVTGIASAGETLSCSGGRVTVHVTRVVYRWVREGRPIPGAASRLYRVREVDEGTTLVCQVTAYSGGSVVGTVAARGRRVAVPNVSGCPAATGSFKALLRLLGATRARALRAFAGSSSSGQEFEDLFCLTPAGLLVGYPPARLLSSLPAGERGRFEGRVVWISTSNAYYSILGVGPGTALATAGRLLKLIGPFHVGSNVWYLAHDGTYVVVLIVRGGVVDQVGVADWSLAGEAPPNSRC